MAEQLARAASHKLTGGLAWPRQGGLESLSESSNSLERNSRRPYHCERGPEIGPTLAVTISGEATIRVLCSSSGPKQAPSHPMGPPLLANTGMRMIYGKPASKRPLVLVRFSVQVGGFYVRFAYFGCGPILYVWQAN